MKPPGAATAENRCLAESLQGGAVTSCQEGGEGRLAGNSRAARLSGTLGEEAPLADTKNPVHDAVDRWVAKGLVDAELGAALKAETDATSRAGAHRLSRYLLAVAGAAVLVTAAGIFLDWAWPLLDEGARTLFLAATGIAVNLWGARVEVSSAWRPAGILLQVAGLALLLGAVTYSFGVWEPQTVPAVVVSSLGLAYALTVAVRALKRDPVLPAVHLVFGMAFLTAFLHDAAGLDQNLITWILDAVVLVLTLVLIRLLRRDPEGVEYPWALNAFVAAMYGAFFLTSWTTFGVLEWEDLGVVAMDLWLVLLAALTLWGIHRAPPGLRRAWFERHLAWLIVAAIPMGFWTAHEVLGRSDSAALVLVSGAGVLGFLYARRRSLPGVMAASAFAFVVGIWFWAVERAGALGVVAALAVTAGLLFWLSGRWTGGEESVS